MSFSQSFRYEIIIAESSPFSEIAAFVDRARAAGATAETPVQAVPVHNDPEVIDHLAVDLDSATRPSATTVAVSVPLLRQVRDLLGELAASDGDVRSSQNIIEAAHKTLVKLADGEAVDELLHN